MGDAMKILVIDDDDQVRDVIRLWLEKEGFDVTVAGDGKEGIEMQRSDPAALLICDLIMPVQEGLETINQFNAEFPQVGIIAISGGGKIGPESYLSVAGHLGAWKVFKKPLDMQEVVAAVREWGACHLT